MQRLRIGGSGVVAGEVDNMEVSEWCDDGTMMVIGGEIYGSDNSKWNKRKKPMVFGLKGVMANETDQNCYKKHEKKAWKMN